MRSSALDEILQRLQQAQTELEQELDRLLDEKRQQFQYHLKRRRVVFEKSMRRWQKQFRTNAWAYLRDAPLPFILSSPLIYGMVIPLALLDLTITVYQQVCFRIYRIPLVKRSDHLIIDRHHLAYLNVIEKFNCIYCGYANGLLSYAREISARTEQYWCPIKHARRKADEHPRYPKFFDYGDAEAYGEGLQDLRRNWDDGQTLERSQGLP
ncbi:MAG: hypothetical protein QNJ69_06965 [Gammaproteobacteria bacterium]|nr:hypothetical protein [Gammaproteobacteria bacterium]